MLFDWKKMDQTLVIILVLTIILIARESNGAAAIFTAVLLFLGALRMCLKRPEITIQTKDLFESNFDVNEFKALMKEDAKFASAVEYVYALDSESLLKFARLITELRDRSNQNFLKEFSRLFRKETK